MHDDDLFQGGQGRTIRDIEGTGIAVAVITLGALLLWVALLIWGVR